MDVVAALIMSSLSDDDSAPAPFHGPSKILYADPRQNQYLAVEKVSQVTLGDDKTTEVDLMVPLCRFITDAKSAAEAEAGLEALYSILESTGHKMRTSTWCL